MEARSQLQSGETKEAAEVLKVMLYHCDRCKKAVDGAEGVGFTAGFYLVAPPSGWAKYARPYETIVCDRCMFADLKYIADYGAH